VYEGEVVCSNADLIRNHAFSWSRMTESEIADKTGIKQRLYTELKLEQMALLAARAALEKSGRKPSEIGAILFCSCTSARLFHPRRAGSAANLGSCRPPPPMTLWLHAQACRTAFLKRCGCFRKSSAGIGGVCGEVLRQDRNCSHISNDFWRRRGRGHYWTCPEGAAPDIEVMQTYAAVHGLR